mgnify:CR=1 FL=1
MKWLGRRWRPLKTSSFVLQYLETLRPVCSELDVEGELPEVTESEANQVPVDILLGHPAVDLIEHGLQFLSEENGPSSSQLGQETVVVWKDERQLRHIDVQVAVLISGSHVIGNLGRSVHEQVPQLPVVEDSFTFLGEDVDLRGQLEGSLEAVVSGSSIGALSERNDPAVPEGSNVVSVNTLVADREPEDVLALTDEVVDGTKSVMDAVVSESAEGLALVATTSSINDSLMVEFMRDRMNKADETVAVVMLELTVHVSHEVSGGLGDVSGVRSLKFK